MKNSIRSNFFSFFMLFNFCLNAQTNHLFVEKMTAINPTSFTDVVYVGSKDTVVISTYSGRLSLIVKNRPKEKIIANLGDEIYSLAYNSKNKEIAASTLEGGVKIVNIETGRISKSLKVGKTWSNNILFSNDFNYLIAHDVKGNRYVWDVKNNYEAIPLSSKVPNGRIFEMSDDGMLKIVSPQKLFIWDFKEEKINVVDSINIMRFGDIDEKGNILSVDFNTCALFDYQSKKNVFTLKHPNWLRYYKDYPNYENLKKQNPDHFTADGYLIMEDYSMQLTMVKFIKDKICTASIDRSIRVWDKETGNLLDTFKGHRATVNRIKVNKLGNQLVSIDLKGGIKFWEF